MINNFLERESTKLRLFWMTSNSSSLLLKVFLADFGEVFDVVYKFITTVFEGTEVVGFAGEGS